MPYHSLPFHRQTGKELLGWSFTETTVLNSSQQHHRQRMFVKSGLFEDHLRALCRYLSSQKSALFSEWTRLIVRGRSEDDHWIRNGLYHRKKLLRGFHLFIAIATPRDIIQSQKVGSKNQHRKEGVHRAHILK